MQRIRPPAQPLGEPLRSERFRRSVLVSGLQAWERFRAWRRKQSADVREKFRRLDR